MIFSLFVFVYFQSVNYINHPGYINRISSCFFRSFLLFLDLHLHAEYSPWKNQFAYHLRFQSSVECYISGLFDNQYHILDCTSHLLLVNLPLHLFTWVCFDPRNHSIFNSYEFCYRCCHRRKGPHNRHHHFLLPVDPYQHGRRALEELAPFPLWK